MVRRDGRGFGVGVGAQFDGAMGARLSFHRHRIVDGGGEHDALVVVGMISEEFDAAGGAGLDGIHSRDRGGTGGRRGGASSPVKSV